MRKSRISKKKQERLIEYFAAGTTAMCIACLVQVNKSSAASYFQRLRQVISLQLELEKHEVFRG